MAESKKDESKSVKKGKKVPAKKARSKPAMKGKGEAPEDRSGKNTNQQDAAADASYMEAGMGRSLESLASAFTASARRWEAIVYPSLFAFILLAVYGFYLIYNLTNDVGRVADNMEEIVISMEEISTNMAVISNNMVVMTQTLDSQSSSMHEMTFYMRNIDRSMVRMRYDISVMNNSVSRPMQFMNTFLPW